MIEQAFHVLKPHGTLIVLSPYDRDDFFPPVLKKMFGRSMRPMEGDNRSSGAGATGTGRAVGMRRPIMSVPMTDLVPFHVAARRLRLRLLR